MFNQYQEIQYEDCPNCKTGKAFMGSSSWGHNIMCCSDKCGEDIAEKIEANTSSNKYRKAVESLERAKDRVRSIKYRGTGVESDPFEHVNGSI